MTLGTPYEDARLKNAMDQRLFLGMVIHVEVTASPGSGNGMAAQRKLLRFKNGQST